MFSARALVVTMLPNAPRGRASLLVLKVGYSLLICLLLMPAGLLSHAAPPGGLPGSSADRATLPALSSVMAGATATITPSPTSGCPHTWQVVDSPGVWYATLYAVSASSATDIWAVGRRRYGQNTHQTLTEHWDGTAWTVVPSPNVGTSTNVLIGVAALGPADAWAVGFSQDIISPTQPLIIHWDGVAWTNVPGPNLSSAGLSSVSALTPNDVWASGSYFDAGESRTLILHWDGTAWTQVPSPSIAGWTNNVDSISARTPTDIWAVGTAYRSGSTRTLILHWNGVTWTIVPSPDPGHPNNYLTGVVALAADDVWAVGASANGSTLIGPLLEHWDGTAWTIVPGPAVPSGFMRNVSGLSSNDVWAVGTYFTGTNQLTLVEHWDGTAWTQVASPNPSSYASNQLFDVVALSATDAWAVGHTVSDALILHYAPFCGTPQPSPSPSPSLPPAATATPSLTAQATGTATATSTIAVTPSPNATNVATPTSCPVEFSDVPPGSAFHLYVRCLACRGIISGYADGTFRPNNEITRGQLAKIVSNAAGFTESPDPQIFEDVPSSNTFYQWINRLARRGHMSGYPCGGAGEPCLTGMPYFRPFANATRGQTSKIVSNAAGFTEESTEQTFDDVPPTHTFYREIQRLASREIMGGYECGGPGEPCLSGKPYFRPANNVTRGQSSKIVANTFFPGCPTPAR